MSNNEENMDVEEEVVASENLDNEVVLTKYRIAADVANKTIQNLMKELSPNKSILELCKLGDQFVTNSLKKHYRKLDKGVAFPTCVSVNEKVCHFSPMNDDTSVLKEGDVVRLDVGVQLDGYCAVAAHTVVLTKETITGERANAIAAAECATQVALRLLKPGNKNTDVSKALALVAKNYGVNFCEGVLSHQLKRYVVDGSQVIILKPTPEQLVKEFTFKVDEVYSLDIVVSTGKGKLREYNPVTTIFKRNPKNTYKVKLNASKKVLTDIKKYNNLAFNLRNLDAKYGKLGMGECQRQSLVDSYPVLCERPQHFVAQIKSTVFLQTRQTVLATSQKMQAYSTEIKVENEDIKSILKRSLKNKKKKTKKQK